MVDQYRLLRSASSAADFHARQVPEPASCEIWQHDITAPALVLGSTQTEEIVDREACRRADIEVVRRRSGGGAVLLMPGQVTWVDVIVPRGTTGWADDIHRPMRWLGRHLAAAVADGLAVDGTRETAVAVHDGGMVTTPWSSTVCFDGLGPGEVLLDGAKLIGISQRRTRGAARLQCCWYTEYDPALLVSLLAPSLRPPPTELAAVATLPAATAAALPALLLARLSA